MSFQPVLHATSPPYRCEDPGDYARLVASVARWSEQAGCEVPAEPLARMIGIYSGARSAPLPAGAQTVPQNRRAELLALQRESALGRICPEGGPR